MVSRRLCCVFALAVAAGGCDRTVAPSCPADMVLIPAGPAVLGTKAPAKAWQRRQTTPSMGAYCIDPFEYPNRRGELPRSGVTWTEADALCQAAGKRLCTEDEWERACRGPEGRTYAYGNERDPDRCNTPITGGGPGPGKPPPLAASGSHEGCRTSEGVYDLNGNLSEWVSDGYQGAPEPFNRSATPDPATWRVLRGGTMWNLTFYGQECLSRHGHEVTFLNMDDGFRCCADASPSGSGPSKPR